MIPWAFVFLTTQRDHVPAAIITGHKHVEALLASCDKAFEFATVNDPKPSLLANLIVANYADALLQGTGVTIPGG